MFSMQFLQVIPGAYYGLLVIQDQKHRGSSHQISIMNKRLKFVSAWCYLSV